MQEQSHQGEKGGFVYTWAEYYLQPNIVHEKIILSMQFL